MAGYQKGGVHTKKIIALMAVAILAATAILCVAQPVSAADDDFPTYADIRTDTFMVGVGKKADFTIFAFGGTDVSYVASLKDSGGNTVGSVSPSTGTSVADDGTTLSVTAPGDPGTYVLNVVFTFKDSDAEKTVTRTAPLKVVTPITLTAKLTNDSGTLTNLKVWFIVDGNIIEESEQEVEVPQRIGDTPGTKTVTYEWVTSGLSNGSHKVSVDAEIGIMEENAIQIKTAGTFYVGQTSYSLIETLLIVLLIVVLIVLIIVIRKPVKNVGKPKGRR